ncbi:hypothetical protein ACOSQ2_003980 [Xanthoceras sorbifolium]
MLIALNAKNKLGFRPLGLSQGFLDISTYFTCLKILWDELKDFQPIPVCNCGGMKNWVDYQQHEYVMQFLVGLNKSYSAIRAQILMLDPLPNVSKVLNLVIQEEQQRTLGSNPSSGFSSSESMAFSAVSSTPYVAAFSSQSMKKKDRPICSHCGIMGHTMDRCYKLHRYPPGYKPKGKAQQQQQSLIQSISKSTLSSSSGVSSPFAMTATASSSSPSHLTADQCQQLIAYLSTHCSGNLFSFPFSNHCYLNSRTWVIDSSAMIDHLLLYIYDPWIVSFDCIFEYFWYV